MASKKPMLNFVIEEILLNRIDDFRFNNRFSSRAAAIKWLLEFALDLNPDIVENSKKNRENKK